MVLVSKSVFTMRHILNIIFSSALLIWYHRPEISDLEMCGKILFENSEHPNNHRKKEKTDVSVDVILNIDLVIQTTNSQYKVSSPQKAFRFQ